MRNRHTTLKMLLLLSLAMCSATAEAQNRRQAQPGKEPPHPPKVGEQAPDFELKTLDGDIVSLEKLTEDSPVVILVLRGWPGYQCPICNRQVGEFLNKQSDFANVQLVMIYPGPADLLAEHAKEFQGAKSFPDNFHYVIDPDYKFTNAWGLRWEAPRETAYPSTFVVGNDRKILFGQTVVSHRDRVNASTVLEVLAKPEQ
ncbi:peroxiredoxin-like family protein [Rhodopirellula sp. SWK7]|uniref:peroxiredoxin-like family protein n=1 Tax=Rhodopirellula sp. SWK7 TaxID=595460 RepID=UPI0002BD3F96|nr:peroxiredoxin-like family protein [Rhodopirellula sp. SWK7]EMI46964.1 alkyl hydroperoxide reductase/ Thiol specific antioxidant/ Mal allergen [Rhodopirellula sp. SWK7]